MTRPASSSADTCTTQDQGSLERSTRTILTPGPISDEGLATYVKSADHFRNETKKAGVEVVIQNHPLMLPLQAWLDKLDTRKKGDPNPVVVGKAGYQKFIDVLYACSEVNVARRKST